MENQSQPPTQWADSTKQLLLHARTDNRVERALAAQSEKLEETQGSESKYRKSGPTKTTSTQRLMQLLREYAN